MANCSRCGQATELFVNGTPICPTCEDRNPQVQTKPPSQKPPKQASTDHQISKAS